MKKKNLDWPHNDALVIEIMLAEFGVTRSLSNTDSSVNMIYKDTLDKMELPNLQINPFKHPLTGFNGSSQQVV